MKSTLKKFIGFLLMFVGVWFTLAAIYPLVARPYFHRSESIYECILAVVSILLILAGVKFWGWQRKYIVLGKISVVFGSVLSFLGINPLILKSYSPEIDIPEVSVLKPLLLGVICIICGIFSIRKHKEIEMKQLDEDKLKILEGNN